MSARHSLLDIPEMCIFFTNIMKELSNLSEYLIFKMVIQVSFFLQSQCIFNEIGMRIEKIYLLGDDFLNYPEITKKRIVCE